MIIRNTRYILGVCVTRVVFLLRGDLRWIVQMIYFRKHEFEQVYFKSFQLISKEFNFKYNNKLLFFEYEFGMILEERAEYRMRFKIPGIILNSNDSSNRKPELL